VLSTDTDVLVKLTPQGGTKPILDSDVDIKSIASREECANYTGADLAALVREASIAAFRDLILSKPADAGCATANLKVSARHFETAMAKTKPSVTTKV
jgi:ribosome biogenesis ATPase